MRLSHPASVSSLFALGKRAKSTYFVHDEKTQRATKSKFYKYQNYYRNNKEEREEEKKEKKEKNIVIGRI